MSRTLRYGERGPEPITQKTAEYGGLLRSASRAHALARASAEQYLHLDFDVHAGGECQIRQRLDDLRRRRVDVDEALVDAHLELFP